MNTAKTNQVPASSQRSSSLLTSFITTETTIENFTRSSNLSQSAHVETFETEAIYSLSPMQQGMLFHHLYEPQSGVDIEQVVCTLRERVDEKRFVEAWQQIIDRHAVLRTCFGWNAENEPIQQVRSSIPVMLKRRDWQELTSTQHAEQFSKFLIHDRHRSFDLSNSLMRLTLIQIAPELYQFVWTFHHILLDGRSMTKVLQEVFALYDAPSFQFSPSRPYRDYIEQLQRQDWAESQSYWQQLLSGFATPTPLLTVPTLQPPEKLSGHATAEIQLSSQFTQALQSFSHQHRITPNTVGGMGASPSSIQQRRNGGIWRNKSVPQVFAN